MPTTQKVRLTAQEALELAAKAGLYSRLGVGPNASSSEIERSAKSLLFALHPDRFSNEREKAAATIAFKRVVEARETLSDPQRRAAYDHAQASPRGPERAPQASRYEQCASTARAQQSSGSSAEIVQMERIFRCFRIAPSRDAILGCATQLFRQDIGTGACATRYETLVRASVTLGYASLRDFQTDPALRDAIGATAARMWQGPGGLAAPMYGAFVSTMACTHEPSSINSVIRATAIQQAIRLWKDVDFLILGQHSNISHSYPDLAKALEKLGIVTRNDLGSNPEIKAEVKRLALAVVHTNELPFLRVSAIKNFTRLCIESKVATVEELKSIWAKRTV